MRDVEPLLLKKLIPVSECRFFALNHWQIAVDTLQRNFPHAMTFCESIEQSSAQTFGFPKIDLLWASPSCVHHSNARGGKPRDDQQRAHATEVLERWLRQADIPVFIMENVREFLSWGPLDAFGKPVKERKGEYFNGFVSNLKELGYEVDWRILNAADYGDPTTRKRLFLATTPVAKRGIDIFECDHAFFFGQSFDYESREQAAARIRLPNKQRPCHYYDMLYRDSLAEPPGVFHRVLHGGQRLGAELVGRHVGVVGEQKLGGGSTVLEVSRVDGLFRPVKIGKETALS